MPQLRTELTDPSFEAGQKSRQSKDKFLSTFWLIAVFQVRGQLRSRRLQTGALVSIALCVLASFVQCQRYLEAHSDSEQFMQTWRQSLAEQLQRDESLEVESMRGLSPLVTLSTGLEWITPFRFFSTKEGIRFGESRGAHDPIEALFGHIDIAVVVEMIMSLLAIALTFDTVCGEREKGTLSVLLSYPISRSEVLLSKVLGSVIATTLIVVAGIAAGVVTQMTCGVPFMGASHWFVFTLIACMYVAAFATLGSAVSSLSREPPTAMLASLTLWAAAVVVIPRMVAVVGAAIDPPSTSLARSLELDASVSQLRAEQAREMHDAYRRFLDRSPGSSDDTLSADVAAATLKMVSARRRLLERMLDKTLHEEEERDLWVRIFSTASPASLFQEAASELAWTGRLQRRHFERQARLYDDEVGRKLVESRHFLHAGELANSGDKVSALLIVDNVRPFMIPFRTTWVSSREIIHSVALDGLSLATTGILISIAGYIAFARMDIRP